ncbi:hypothetical protein ACJ2A9_22710 [Anaerobacillus sp. MEB173]|uniref:type IV pilus modification PilV family protein n=1 Tax=Anaerobacillus sp. MEB173 TaxID=3383345 RepID=UPI003F8F87BD
MKRYFNSRGTTLLELLFALFVLTVTLTVIISVLMSGRAGIVSSWDRTEANSAAVQVLEQLKAASYSEVLAIKNNEKSLAAVITVDSHYEINVDLFGYEEYPSEEMLQVVVTVSDSSGKRPLEKATILRKGVTDDEEDN